MEANLPFELERRNARRAPKTEKADKLQKPRKNRAFQHIAKIGAAVRHEQNCRPRRTRQSLGVRIGRLMWSQDTAYGDANKNVGIFRTRDRNVGPVSRAAEATEQRRTFRRVQEH
jgi:hypothetical protein